MVTACFKDRSTFIKCLVFLVSVLIMILVALAVILVTRTAANNICKTEHCINLSAQVIRYADKSMNPCDDFHGFVCGSFIKNRREIPIPTPEEELNTMIKDLVQMEDSKPFIMQKSFYLSCSNLGAIEMDDDETLLNLFYSVGDWPVLRGSHWSGAFFEWTEVAKKIRRTGLKFDWFLDFSVYPDINDTGLNILKIDIPSLSPFKSEEIFPRQKFFTKVAIALGAPERLAHYETGRTIDFEQDLRTLADNHRNQKKRNWVSPPKVTINEVQTLWPNIRWLELINNITGLNLMGSDYVIFDEVIDYVKDLNHLIYGIPKRIVADYMMWKVVEEYWQFLSQPVRELFEEYYEKEYNRPPELNRQKFCINESRKQFPLIAESEYIRRHVTQQKRELVKEMLFIVRDKFISMVKKATWINKEVRHRVVFKLENMEFLVGGPRQIFDEYGFAEDLGLFGFVFKSRNVIDMLMERRIRFYDNYFRVVNKAVTNSTLEFYEKVLNISRFTVINGNTLVIPAAVLRDVFYNPKLPNYFNYATVGKALAQAIFEHVFDLNNESATDEDNDNYNSFRTLDIFESAVKCLTKESSSYMHNAELKRPKKMRQLLAQFVAPEVAYESYKEWAVYHPQEFGLPALEFTPSQLFWIHTSKLYCSKIYSKRDRDYSRFKIIGPLRNSRNFAADFNCSQSSTILPKRQCRIL
ncbi:hypothetical protein Zmor_021461 [Zophobas morio]|uniref:Uncharacterized protein n=1 Tax=Zophobas morio TaxID=2755281 RepID=A0AA38I8N8_9CUCU|nr:hypothetical protein Zmor_021461 [Zophobas morio]